MCIIETFTVFFSMYNFNCVRVLCEELSGKALFHPILSRERFLDATCMAGHAIPLLFRFLLNYHFVHGMPTVIAASNILFNRCLLDGSRWLQKGCIFPGCLGGHCLRSFPITWRCPHVAFTNGLDGSSILIPSSLISGQFRFSNDLLFVS